MNAQELQEKLQECYKLPIWKVIKSTQPGPGLSAFHRAERWSVEARVSVEGVEIGAAITDTKEFFSREDAIIVIGQKIAYAIGYNIIHFE